MFNKIITVLFLTLSFITIVISCSSSGDNNQELKSVSSLRDKINVVKKQVITETTYDVTVDLDQSSFISSLKSLTKAIPFVSSLINLDDSTCSGTSKLILYNDYSQKLEGKLKCLGILDIDLSDTMGDTDIERVEEDMSKYSYFGSVLRENNPVITDKKVPEGTAYFQPPRPILINPMVSADTINKKMSEDATMVFINSNTKYLLFNSREMFISLNPIIITKMIIHTSVKDLISKKNPNGPDFLSNLVGDITINFVMNKHEMK